MTDLEMTQLCADAMGIKTEVHPIRGTIMRHWFMDQNVEREYNPLHDDGQAMALVKKLNLSIGARSDPSATHSRWYVHCKAPYVEGIDGDLNRAIVECIALIDREVSK